MENKGATILYQNKLYRYVADTLFKKGHWKECWAILYKTGNLKIYKDNNDTKDHKHKPSLDLDLQQSVLHMAFGEDALKLLPPRVTDDKYQNVANLIAVPKDKHGQIITWFCTVDGQDLMLWLRHIAESVSNHKPPLLGARHEKEKIANEVKQEFGLEECSDLPALDWIIYWLYNISKARRGSKDSPQIVRRTEEAAHLTKTEANLIEGDAYQDATGRGAENIDLSLNIEDILKGTKPKVDQRNETVNYIEKEWNQQIHTKIDSNSPRDQSVLILSENMYYYSKSLSNGCTKSEIVINVGKRPFKDQVVEDFIYIHLLKNEENHRKIRLLERQMQGQQLPLEKISQF